MHIRYKIRKKEIKCLTISGRMCGWNSGYEYRNWEIWVTRGRGNRSD